MSFRLAVVSIITRNQNGMTTTSKLLWVLLISLLWKLDPHRNVKPLAAWNHHPQHRPDNYARRTLQEEKLRISLFILFDTLKINNSTDRKVVVPLLYVGELPEIFNLS
jgi:hypothetical protein